MEKGRAYNVMGERNMEVKNKNKSDKKKMITRQRL